jgi:glycosyltransferase involved in cell wall biosynthesis
MRILLVSQLYPGRADPDLGPFVRQIELALRARGHEVELAVLDRRAGGKRRYLDLLRRTRSTATRFGPDVVYAHFLLPAGLIALAGRAPLVVTAHGRDVRNVGSIPGVRAATRLVVRRAAAVVCVSEYLRRELETRLPDARGKTEVVSSGVDLGQFPLLPRNGGPGPAYLCVGSLSERKNVVRLADAFARVGRGTLTYVGDGPLRTSLEGRPGVTVGRPVPHDEIARYLAGADVLCQPSLIEPLGQAVLEAMACGRPVVASTIGGAAELVTPEAGILVDPLDVDAIARGLAQAAELPVPNDAARAAASEHDVTRQAERIEAILERAALSRGSRGGRGRAT